MKENRAPGAQPGRINLSLVIASIAAVVLGLNALIVAMR